MVDRSKLADEVRSVDIAAESIGGKIIGMTEAINILAKVIERWGFPILVAVAAGYVLRNDVMLPLVDAHTRFLEQLSETQKEIVETTREQTRLLYAMQTDRDK
jgi:hypothetical protein